MSWQLAKRSLIIFLPLALIAAGTLYRLHRAEVDDVVDTQQASEARLIDVIRQRIAYSLTGTIADLMYLDDQAALQDWLLYPDLFANRRLTAEYTGFATHQQAYDQIRFIDLDGHEQVRVNWSKAQGASVVPDAELQDKSAAYYVRAASRLEKGQVFISDLDLNTEHGTIEQPIKPVIRMAAPVFGAPAQKGAPGAKKGIIVLNFLAGPLLDRIAAFGRADRSRIWLINSAGYWLLGPSPSDEFAFMYPGRFHRQFQHRFPNAWSLLRGQTRMQQFAADGGLFTVTPVSPGAMPMTDQDPAAPATTNEVTPAKDTGDDIPPVLPGAAVQTNGALIDNPQAAPTTVRPSAPTTVKPAAPTGVKPATPTTDQSDDDDGPAAVDNSSDLTADSDISNGEATIVAAPTWYLVSYLPEPALAAQIRSSTHNLFFGYVVVLLILMILSIGIARLYDRLSWKTKELTETETYFRAAVDGSPNAFFVFNLRKPLAHEDPDEPGVETAIRKDGFFLSYLNPLAEEMIGLSRAEAKGRPIKRVMKNLRGTRIDDDGSMDRYYRVLQEETLLEREYQVAKGSLAGRYFEEQIVPLPNGIAVSCRDITERKQVEGLKNEFVSTVSHELRTPLTAIRGSLGLVVGGIGGELPGPIKSLLEIAHSNCERLVRLINDILDIEKIESGRLSFKIRSLPVMAMLRQAIDQNMGFAEKFDVNIVLEIPTAELWASDCPGGITTPDRLMLRADSDRLLQVLANLLSNAIKFSHKGGKVTVSFGLEESRIRVAVTDQGQGIPEEFRRRIFEKFAQADGSDIREKGGTGLGLSIVKSIMQQMSGTIGFNSVVGKGSTFFFTVPRAPDAQPIDSGSVCEPAPLAAVTSDAAAAQPAAATTEIAAETQTQPPVPSAARSPRILICEDEADIANLLRLTLQRAGFTIDVRHDAETTMQALIEGDYAALVLDLGLPDRNGIEVVREMRAMAKLRATPIIVVSAKAEAGRLALDEAQFKDGQHDGAAPNGTALNGAEAGNQVSGDAIGLIDWMVKPIDTDHLVRMVRERFKQISAGRQGGPARVLHVEDDRDIAEIIRQSLTAPVLAASAAGGAAASAEAEVVWVSSLADAKQQLAEHHFDLAILDLGLPDGSGLDLLPLLGTLRPQPIPVVLFTASEVPNEITTRVESVLIKSKTSEDKLVATIRQLIG